MLGLVVALGLIAAWCILESVTLVTVITLANLAGLELIVWVGRDALGTLPVRIDELFPPLETEIWLGILSGPVFAFYAFIGFEDMVNVAEKVHDAPRTIILTLILTGILYIAVALVAVLAMPFAELAAADAPLAAIYEHATGRPATVISLIGIVSVLNGALIQVILASRVALWPELGRPLARGSRPRSPIHPHAACRHRAGDRAGHAGCTGSLAGGAGAGDDPDHPRHLRAGQRGTMADQAARSTAGGPARVAALATRAGRHRQRSLHGLSASPLGRALGRSRRAKKTRPRGPGLDRKLVEPGGIEPPTS